MTNQCNNRILDSAYYNGRYEKIKKIAGPRYSPETNVDIPLSDVFHGLCRTEEFYNEIRRLAGMLQRNTEFDRNDWHDEEINEGKRRLSNTLCKLHKMVGDIKSHSSEPINWEGIARLAKTASNQVSELLHGYARLKQELEKTEPVNRSIPYQPTLSERVTTTIRNLYYLHEAIDELCRLSQEPQALLSNNPYLIIRGKAGMGKTHLLCDLFRVRTQNNDPPQPTFLTFGELYKDASDFWDNFLCENGLESFFKDKTEFLTYLDFLAKENCSRAVIMIDALNESGSNFWQNYLSGLLDDLNGCKHIALVVTIRTGFENIILTEDQMNRFECVEHTGFAEVEWAAAKKYFEHYGVPFPKFPILYPEFRYPLFLKLLCKAYAKERKDKHKREDEQEIFRGHEGSTFIFESFIDNVSKSLMRNYQLNRKTNPDVWNAVIKPMAEAMVETISDSISEKELENIIIKSYPQVNSSDFVLDMERSLLISRYPSITKAGSFAIRFPFQKFSDHLITRYIFKTYEEEVGKGNRNLGNAKKFFSRRRKLGKAIDRRLFGSLIEALSTQCPEHLKGVEFIDVAPYLMLDHYKSYRAIEGFIESLVWREPSAFSPDLHSTNRIIRKYVFRREDTIYAFFDALLTIAPIENHPYNARWLDDFLKRHDMPLRDAMWSVFLHCQHKANLSLDRILNWVSNDDAIRSVTDGSLYLTGIALSWFLTTPNRFIRDRATKGLTSLFIYKPTLIIQLLKNFEQVDDIYIVERLYAAAYGCALHNRIESKILKELAEYIYDKIFSSVEVPRHILLRDYARGIIEIALSRMRIACIDERRIKPPYNSKWPTYIPSDKELEAKYYPDVNDRLTEENSHYAAIWYSVMGSGDFARYVIGTNSNKCSWTGRKIDDDSKPLNQFFQEFKSGLSAKQKDLWDSIGHYKLEKRLHSEDEQMHDGYMNVIEWLKQAFIASLSDEQRHDYTRFIEPNITDNQQIDDPYETFDLSIAQRWIFKRVIELGYSPELHYRFDDWVNRYDGSGRSEHKAERIGKKYQWIAYHEFMGMLADNYKYKEDNWLDPIGYYTGPWEPHIRDIDPTLQIKNDKHIEQSIPIMSWKNDKCVIKNWHKQLNDSEWLKMDKDIPCPLSIIEVVDDNLYEWLLLKANFHWEMATPPDIGKYDEPHRNVELQVKSCIIRKNDLLKIVSLWNKKELKDYWMPCSDMFYHIFLGEYPHSYAYECIKGRRDEFVMLNDLDIPMLATDDCYSREFLLDCSYERSRVEIFLPCATLVRELDLAHKYVDGRFYKNEKLVASPLSVFNEDGRSGLLFDKSTLFSHLNNKGHTMIWSLTGSKVVIAMSNRPSDVLKINGLYWLDGQGELKGSFSTSHIP